MQFLTESAALCVTGGIIGTIAGYAIAWGLAFAAGAFGLDMGSMTWAQARSGRHAHAGHRRAQHSDSDCGAASRCSSG
ncbi:MAG: hypothetical protein ACLTSX_00760 [Collinsella sp.]